jgi:predicted peptidase
MRKAASILMFLIAIVSSTAIYGNSQSQSLKHIKSATAITEVFGDGQKVTAVAVEYDQDITNSKLSKSVFTIDGRTITNVYANTAASKAAQGVNGKYVIIELSPADNGAATFFQSGRTSARKEAKASVSQSGEIFTTNGEIYTSVPEAISTTKVVNMVVDDFKQFEYKDTKTRITLKYNLFIPKNYDKSKSYPMVLFIHDAGVCGKETDLTLIQGIGAVIWATPSEQAKHECFVLAPQYERAIVNDKSEITEEGDITVNLVNSITSQYNIDRNRLYTTGQSMGCMTSIALNIKYPDLFAASFLVAGQWDASVVAPLAKDQIWIIVAEGDTKAFPGMNDISAALENQGAKISRAKWNARAGEAEKAANVKKMIDEKANIKYVVFEKGTVFPEGKPSGMEHMATWKVAYNIEGVRDWLFMQKK